MPASIHGTLQLVAFCLLFLAASGQVSGVENVPHTPQNQSELPPMLQLDWSAGPRMPQGMQDNHVALMDDWLVSVLGFCGGADDDWKPGRYPRGFLNRAWGLDLRRESSGWVELPSYPGAPRQAGQGAVVDDELYLWGGFSYDVPYTYADGQRLSRTDGDWTWTPLPELPSPSCWAGTVAVGSKIYALGGADYDAQRFYCPRDRTGRIPIGTRLIVFDTQRPEAGWTPRAPCPGTPRCLTAAVLVDAKVYILGGISVMPSGSYCNVVDNWRYDPATDMWERLRDLPMSGSGSSSSTIAYRDRYILLPCGYQYDAIMRPDGRIETSYGTPQKVHRTWKSHPKFATTHYFNHHYVYDTHTDKFGTATPLPFDDVATITVVRGDTAYMFPGETGGFEWEGEYFGHHPEFVLRGQIRELDWE